MSLLEYLRRPTSSSSYVPQIDGLRFLALLPVLLWHAGLRGERFYDAKLGYAGAATDKISYWMPHGHIGVFIFSSSADTLLLTHFYPGAARR